MGWFNNIQFQWPLARRQPSVQDSVNTPQKGGYHFYPIDGARAFPYIDALSGPHSEESIMAIYQSVGEVFVPIHLIATAVTKAEWQIRTVRKDTEEDNKDFNRLISSPNYMQTWEQFIYDAVVSEYIGNRYWYTQVPGTLKRKLENIVGLWTLPPQKIRIEKRSPRPKIYSANSMSDIVERYCLDMGVDSQEFTPEQVLHEPTLTTGCKYDVDDLKGYSPLLSVRKAITNLIAVYEARGAIYLKRGALGFLVSKKSDDSGNVALTKQEKEEAISELAGATSPYGFMGGQSLAGITRQPLEWIQVAMSIKDLEPFTETKADAAVIFAALQVPEPFMPGAEWKYENYRIATRNFFTNTVIPCATRIASALHKILGLEDRVYIKPDFSHIEELQENKKEQAETNRTNVQAAVSAFNANLITLNQALDMLSLPHAADGDQYKRDLQPEQQAVLAGFQNVN